MIEQHITTPKTARYYCSTKRLETCTSVWIVLHGYGQLARFFLKKLEGLAPDDVLLVAPEATHRFYLEGTHGRVGASWMTREDRLADIKDYVNYLDIVAAKILQDIGKPVQVNVLGFSQGASTAVRWACMGTQMLDRLIIWAGAFPPDIDFESHVGRLNRSRIDVVVGTDDEFYRPEQVEQITDLMSNNGVEFHQHSYDGGHDINPQKFQELLSLK